ncbi:MAG: hypothetical protein R8L07_14975 [Alphaproteobacteria bacterium]|nr:hypothetical protein [Alphaproteobacteria bacterium]
MSVRSGSRTEVSVGGAYGLLLGCERTNRFVVGGRACGLILGALSQTPANPRAVPPFCAI